MAKDSFTLDRAETLARKISRYWRNKGHQVRAWVEPIPGTEGEPMYQVRSDLINGAPRGSIFGAIAA